MGICVESRPMSELAFVFAGFSVGLVVGLTGVGGGSLMTPILIFFFGIKPYLAVGTDLLFAAVTKAGGTINLARQRLVPWRVVAQLCAGSIPAALVTLWVLLLALDTATPWKRALPLLLLVVIAVQNAGNFRMPPVVDFHWATYAAKIENGEKVDVAIYPAGWGITVPPRGK